METVTKATLPWRKNPCYADRNVPLPDDLQIGNRILIAVPLSGGATDISVIVADEIGFLDTHGEFWGEWDWADVMYYINLDCDLQLQEE